MKQRLNFSPQPFQNRHSALWILWPLNLLLMLCLVVSLWYWAQLRGRNRDAHRDIAAVRSQQQDVADQQADMARRLEAIDMKRYRKQVAQFHEIQATVQTHWGRLMDRLGELLPEDVRILRLAPAYRGDDGGGVNLALTAEARNKQAQLRFIETLQQAPAFGGVRFQSEQYLDREGVAVAFEITFTFFDGGGR